MQIKRETLAHGTDLEEMRVKLKEAAEAHTMGPAQGSNDYGPV